MKKSKSTSLLDYADEILTVPDSVEKSEPKETTESIKAKPKSKTTTDEKVMDKIELTNTICETAKKISKSKVAINCSKFQDLKEEMDKLAEEFAEMWLR